jgi:N,N'-diacetylchitobiose transport system substrate-binding protein
MRRTTTRTIGAVAAVTVSALALAACGSGSNQSSSGDDKTLTVWMMTGGPGDNAIVKQVNDEFAKKHPGVKVDVQIQQWTSITTKLTTALASDNPPDVVEMGNTQTPLQTYSGGLADLTNDLPSFEDSKNWLSGLVASTQFDGKTYAVPLYGGTKVVMYNKDLFAKAGISKPPTSIAELEKDCGILQKANSSTSDFSGFYMPGQYYFAGLPFVFGKGGEDAVEKDGKWSGALSSPQAQEGLKAWRQFQNTCSTPSSVNTNTNNPDQDKVFADGGAAMIYAKGWEPGAVIEDNPAMKDKLGFFVMPGYDEGSTLPVIVSGSTIGVATASDNIDAAKDWVKIVTGKAFQQTMATQLNLLPISTDFTPTSGVPEQLTVASEAAKNTRAMPDAPGEATIENEGYNEQFFAKIAGSADIKSSAQEYDSHLASVFNSYSH